MSSLAKAEGERAGGSSQQRAAWVVCGVRLAPREELARHIAGIAQGWRNALRGRHDNPLLQAWALAEARRGAGLPRPRRNPGLAALLAAIAALVVLAELILAAAYLGLAAGSDTLFWPLREFVLVEFDFTLLGQLRLFAWAGSVYCLGWLIARVYTALVCCFGLLERAPRERTRLTIDDMLAMTPLTEQETVVACLGLQLRRLGPALLAASAMLGVLATANSLWIVQSAVSSYHYYDALTTYSFRSELPGAVGFGLTMAGLLAIGATLGIANLLCIAIALSCTPRAGLWPQIGACSTLLTQGLLYIWLGLLGIYTTSALGIMDGLESVVAYFGLGLLALLQLGLFLYLARRLAWLRVTLTSALAGIAMLPAAMFCSPFFLSGGDFQVQTALSLLLPFAKQFCVFTPECLLLSLNPGLAYHGAFSDAIIQPVVAALAAMPFLLCMLVVSAEFARDAVRRRKWDAA